MIKLDRTSLDFLGRLGVKDSFVNLASYQERILEKDDKMLRFK